MNKEEKREYDKKYREANKEKIAAKGKLWREANKEKKAAIDKKYREANKEKLDAKRKVYYQANKETQSLYHKKKYTDNKEEVIARNKEYVKNNKDGLYTVYYLKEEHYAGMTSYLPNRLCKHKSKHNRHIEDVEIIGKYETKEEALRVEAALHAMGYLGRHPRDKQQTLKQVL